MASFIETVRSDIIVQALLFIGLGIFLIVMPNITITTIIYLLGGVLAISGAVALISYFRKKGKNAQVTSVLTNGIILILLALVAFLFPEVLASFFSFALGIILILCGVVNTVRAVQLRVFGGYSWIVALIISLLIVAGGFVIVWNPFATTMLFTVVLGVLLLVNGVTDLVIELLSRKHAKTTATSVAPSEQ